MEKKNLYLLYIDKCSYTVDKLMFTSIFSLLQKTLISVDKNISVCILLLSHSTIPSNMHTDIGTELKRNNNCAALSFEKNNQQIVRRSVQSRCQ